MRKVFNQINEDVKEFQAQIDERNNKYKIKGIENHELAWKKTVEDIFDETLKKKQKKEELKMSRSLYAKR